MDACRRLDSELPRARWDQITADGVDRDDGEERESREGVKEAESGRECGKREDIEADVAREDRIGDAERRLVDRPQRQVPRPRGGEPAEESEG